MKEFLLKDFLDHRNEPVFKHQFIPVGNNIRVYYEPEGFVDSSGFEFWALENTGGYADRDEWDPEATFVNCMFTGSAAFDGIRHLYMGSDQTDDYGYHFYPSVQDHIDTLLVIGELEKKYCREKQTA